MTFRFAVNPRWSDLPLCSALLHGFPRDYTVSDYRTTLSIKTVRRGSAWYETRDGRYLVTPDTFLVLNEGQRYSMEVDAASKTETFCPFFQPGFVRARELPERLYPMRGRVAEALRSFGNVPLEDPCDFLYSCYAEPLSVDDAAHVAAMSPFHFQRMFKSAFGISPMQFLQRRRLDIARQLLASTEDDVTSICLSVGFESLGSFSTLFKRTFGVPPSQIRRIGEVCRLDEK